MKKTLFHPALICIVTALISSCTGQEASIASNEIDLIDQLEDHLESSDESALPVPQVGAQILEIFEDSQGDIWFGTSDQGVARYNGQSLDYFSEEDGLCGKTVADIAEDKDGKIWFGTYGDMCIYDRPASNDDVSFHAFEKNGKVPHLGWGWKSVNADSQGNIWVNTHHGIFRFNSPNFKAIDTPLVSEENQSFCNTPGRIALYVIDKAGNYWFGTDGAGVYKYDGSSYTHYTHDDGLLSNNVTSIAEDGQGHIWITCTHSRSSKSQLGGLCKFDGKQFKTFQGKKGLYENDLHTLYADRSGGMWVGATGFGVYHFSEEGFNYYDEPKSVISSQGVHTLGLNSVLEDSRGRIWMGFAGGLYRLDGQSITNVTVNGPWN